MLPVDKLREHLSAVLEGEAEYMVEDGCYLLLFAPLEEYVEELIPVAREMGFSVAYDCMERWSALPGSSDWYERDVELELCRSADLITYTAHSLLSSDSYLAYGNNAFHVPNACDPSLWRDVAPVDDVLYGREITVGYIGSLGNWFDWELLGDVHAGTGVDVAYNIIGNGEMPDHIHMHPTARRSSAISMLGYKSPELVKVYLDHFDMLIVPFKSTELTRCVSPIKVYEALYCGVPVVATGLPQVSDMPGVRVVDSAEGMLEAMDNIDVLRQEAEEHTGDKDYTWRSRANRVQELFSACEM
jgi:glycosyltransferase involved in cell wall biosynthesis